MRYLEIGIETQRAGIELILSALMKLGITDAVVEDPADIDDLLQKEKGYEWDYIDDSVLELKNETPRVTVYLNDDAAGHQQAEAICAAMRALKAQAAGGSFGSGLDVGSLETKISSEDDSAWKDNWKAYFKPAKVSKTIVVKPTWEAYEAQADEKIIEIDPGMAFGTGTHETTSLCIRLMEDYLAPGEKVLDVGCGSGILSIAGALLGASEVLGVEIDPDAVAIAKENIALNHVDGVASAQYGDLTKGIDFQADVIVANLMADLVVMLSKDVAKHLRPGGRYISSGILVEKMPEVVDAMRALGFAILEVKEDGMWCAIVAKR